MGANVGLGVGVGTSVGVDDTVGSGMGVSAAAGGRCDVAVTGGSGIGIGDVAATGAGATVAVGRRGTSVGPPAIAPVVAGSGWVQPGSCRTTARATTAMTPPIEFRNVKAIQNPLERYDVCARLFVPEQREQVVGWPGGDFSGGPPQKLIQFALRFLSVLGS